MAIILLTGRGFLHGDQGYEPGQSIKLIGRLGAADQFDDQCDFSTEIEPTTFKLTAFKDKYKVVRIRAGNRRAKSIKLSPEKDSIELIQADGKSVKGTFNLKAQDGKTWDSLSDDLRSDLAYPAIIRAAKAADEARTGEEVAYLFAFFPVKDVSNVPRQIRYTIATLGHTVTIENRPPAAE